MIENVIHHVGGVGVFGVISVCLFFAFFSGMLLHAARLKRPYLNSMRNLPLENENATTTNPLSEHSHE
jgi:hypothetical protein